MATGKIQQDIVIKVTGQDELEEAAKVVDKLDGEEAEITVEAKVDKALGALDKIADEAKKAADAADALGRALGPELAGRMDLGAAVTDFQRMDLTLEEITANADQLGAKLREIDAQDPGGKLASNFGRTRGGFDKVVDGADQANSAVANMVGNATQDFGEMAGVAGSAGVAVGQLGEYFTDTAFKAAAMGQGMGAALASFTAAAGPIAAISVALALVGKVMEEMSKGQAATKAFHTDQLERFTEATKEGGDALGDYNAKLEETGEVLAVTGQKAGPAWARILPGLGDVTGGLGFLGKFGEIVENILPLLNEAGISSERWVEVVTSKEPTKAMDAFREQVRASNLSAEEQADILIAARSAQEDYAKSVAGSEEANRFFASTVGSVNDLLRRSKDPLDQYADKWRILFDDLADGKDDSQETAAAIDFLSQKLNISKQAVIDLVNQHFDQVLQDQAKAAEENAQAVADAADALEEWGQTLQDQLIGIGDFGQAVADMTGFFATGQRALDAIGKAFALENAPLDQAEQIAEFNDQLRDLVEFTKGLEKVDLAAVFKLDPANINTSDFIAKIRSLRGSVQTEISEAFAAAGGGEAGALAGAQAAQGFVDQIFTGLHGALPKEKILELLGIDDLNLVFKVAIDQQSLATANEILAAFVQIPGVDPLLAFQLRVGLAAGTLKPGDVLTIINDQLKNMDAAQIPSSLLPPEGKSMSDARNAADNFYKLPGNNAYIPTKTSQPANLTQTVTDTQTALNNTWVVIPTKLGAPTNQYQYGTGVTIPYAVPPTTATRRRTVTFARHGRNGVATAAAPAPAAMPTTTLIQPRINISAGAIGNRYDVMRAVQKANHDLVRLLGNRH